MRDPHLEQNARLAVLIDADNASKSVLHQLLREIAEYGVATVKRAYGDWSSPQLASWKDHLLQHSVTPVQQFAYTKGKGATDAALIIDAMDLLHTGRFDGFCIVSSDSDFTPLASRLRESGAVVYGFGEQKTPDAFRNACDKFTFIELLYTEEAKRADGGATQNALRELLLASVSATSSDAGWSLLSQVGVHLRKTDPSFDPRTFGFPKLADLLRKQEYLEVKQWPPSNHPYVRVTAGSK